MTAPDRRRYPPIFGDFAPTSSSRKKHSPPWWHLEEGAEGAEGSGRQGGWGWLVGLAAGWWQGGWGLGLAGGSGGMVAWWHGCMEGNDRFRYTNIFNVYINNNILYKNLYLYKNCHL